jgi:hypothetical protein
MAEKRIFEWPAGVFGETLLALDIVGWVLYFLEKRERWEMLMELNKHLAFLSISLWFFPSLLMAFFLILIAQEMRFKKLITKSVSSMISTESNQHVSSGWRWPKITAWVVIVTILLTVIVTIISLRLYMPDDPVFARIIPAPIICKTADCFPLKLPISRKQKSPNPPAIINSPTCPGGVCAAHDVSGPITVNPPINPNAATITYDCAGVQTWVGRTPETLQGININDQIQRGVVTRMGDLYNATEYTELLNICSEKIKSAPEWQTPYIFCGLAYLAVGNKDKSREMLRHYEENKGPAYEGAPACKEMLDFLRRNLADNLAQP